MVFQLPDSQRVMVANGSQLQVVCVRITRYSGFAIAQEEFVDRGFWCIPAIKSKKTWLFSLWLSVFSLAATASDTLELGSRPLQLASTLSADSLRARLQECATDPPRRTEFSIAHRGAPLQYPEHTREGYIAAARMGAGIIECDVTFTADRNLVCRHSQCDLHSTTNILQTPLAAKCSVPPDLNSNTPFKEVQCCTSDLSLAEFKTLQGRIDNANPDAATVSEYLSLAGTPKAELQDARGTLLSHRESIELFKELGVKMIPELKSAQVPMPFQQEYTQEQYARALVDEYVDAKIDPSSVFLQSFNLQDVEYWLEEAPEFGRQSAWLDGRYRSRSFDVSEPDSWDPSMAELAQSGVRILAPPLWMLLALNEDGNIMPSAYATAAKAAGLDIIAWTLERSGSLKGGGGWYYQTVKKAIKNDGDMYSALDVLAKSVKVLGVFSDWPATVTYYANCMGLE